MHDGQLQITLLRLDNYGPWTYTLGSDREHRIQILQAQLYSAIQKAFAEKDSLVFFNRFDEMIAVTNGITRVEHREIQRAIQDQFPVTISMGIGIGHTPFEAQQNASSLMRSSGSARSPDRNGVITFERTLDLSESYVKVMHVDINGTTDMLTNRVSAYETSLQVMEVYYTLMWHFKSHGVLIFFLGGDNFLGVANGVTEQQIESTLRKCSIRKLTLKCGIGIARTGRKATELATMNLDRIRENRNQAVLSTVNL